LKLIHVGGNDNEGCISEYIYIYIYMNNYFYVVDCQRGANLGHFYILTQKHITCFWTVGGTRRELGSNPAPTWAPLAGDGGHDGFIYIYCYVTFTS